MIRISSVIISGLIMSAENSDNWDELLSAAARLQKIVSGAVLVGGTASALYAKHRISTDVDHVLTDLAQNFDRVLATLECIAGWKTVRVKRPVLILGSLDGIETGIRQLIRTRPLETAKINVNGDTITVPTAAEILRIKAVLILKRNATRDYVDFVALADFLGMAGAINALKDFDEFYPPENEQSPLQQLIIQLAKPLPYDLEASNLSEYKNLDSKWHNWVDIETTCQNIAVEVLD